MSSGTPQPKPSELPRWADGGTQTPTNIVDPPENPGAIPAWAAGVYTVGQTVVRGAPLTQYVVTSTSGTGTSTTGPTGSGQTIDNPGANQVVWQYVTTGAITKNSGWQAGTQPPAQYFNWLFFTIFMWIAYLADLANQNFGYTGGTFPNQGPWTGAHAFTGAGLTGTAASGIALIQVQSVNNSNGVYVTANNVGSQAGIESYSSATAVGFLAIGSSAQSAALFQGQGLGAALAVQNAYGTGASIDSSIASGSGIALTLTAGSGEALHATSANSIGTIVAQNTGSGPAIYAQSATAPGVQTRVGSGSGVAGLSCSTNIDAVPAASISASSANGTALAVTATGTGASTCATFTGSGTGGVVNVLCTAQGAALIVVNSETATGGSTTSDAIQAIATATDSYAIRANASYTAIRARSTLAYALDAQGGNGQPAILASGHGTGPGIYATGDTGPAITVIASSSSGQPGIQAQGSANTAAAQFTGHGTAPGLYAANDGVTANTPAIEVTSGGIKVDQVTPTSSPPLNQLFKDLIAKAWGHFSPAGGGSTSVTQQSGPNYSVTISSTVVAITFLTPLPSGQLYSIHVSIDNGTTTSYFLYRILAESNTGFSFTAIPITAGSGVGSAYDFQAGGATNIRFSVMATG